MPEKEIVWIQVNQEVYDLLWSGYQFLPQIVIHINWPEGLAI